MVTSTQTTARGAARLQDRVAIVTGAGRGIGKAISQCFAAHGAKVLVATRTGSYGQETVDEIRAHGGTAELIETTFGTRDAAEAAVGRAVELWGGVDIVVHNAAYVTPSPIVDIDDDALSEALNVSLRTGLWLIKYSYPYLKESPSGRVLFTSSVASERSQAGFACYGALKGAINSLVRGAALELGPDGITVNAVAPGGTHSASFDASLSADSVGRWEEHIPLRRVGEGRDIANAMLFLASDEAGYVTGRVLTVDGGQTLGQEAY